MSARVCVLPKGITCSVCYFVFYLAINIVSTAFGIPLMGTDIGQRVLLPPDSKQPVPLEKSKPDAAISLLSLTFLPTAAPAHVPSKQSSDLSDPSAMGPTQALESSETVSRSNSRTTEPDAPVSDHATPAAESLWASAVAFIQQHLAKSETGGLSDGLIVGLIVGAIALGAIFGFVGYQIAGRLAARKKLPSPEPRRLSRESWPPKLEKSPITPRRTSSLSRSSSLSPGSQKRLIERSTLAHTLSSSGFKWYPEWGKPPLYVMQENPDVDWSKYLQENPTSPPRTPSAQDIKGADGAAEHMRLLG